MGKSALFATMFERKGTTIESDFDHLIVRVYGTNVRLTVWDIPGKNRQVVSETADLAILLFDISKAETMGALG